MYAIKPEDDHLTGSRPGLSYLVAQPAIAAIAATSVGYATAGSTTVTFTADYETRNKVVVTRSGCAVTIDDRVAIKPGKGCKQVKGDKTRVRCTTKNAPTLLMVTLHDRNDSVVNKSNLMMDARGGSGSDKLVGGPQADVLSGDGICDPSPGNDTIYGNGGNDRIDAGDGADYVSAGDGNDRVLGDSDCVNAADRSGHDTLRAWNGTALLDGGPPLRPVPRQTDRHPDLLREPTALVTRHPGPSTSGWLGLGVAERLQNVFSGLSATLVLGPECGGDGTHDDQRFRGGPDHESNSDHGEVEVLRHRILLGLVLPRRRRGKHHLIQVNTVVN